MTNVSKTETATHQVYEQNGRWQDGLGGSHYTQADAIRAIEDRVARNEHKGINTLTKADGVAMIAGLLVVVFLCYATVWNFNRQFFFSSIGYAAGAVASIYLFYKFFMGTLPSFRTKTYIALVFLVIATHFILLYGLGIKIL